MLFQVLLKSFFQKELPLCSKHGLLHEVSIALQIKSTGFTPLSESNQAAEAIVLIFLNYMCKVYIHLM